MSRIRDAVVVGAGPAGSLTARELARRGLDVLLVERKAWPRSKVCGACLGPAALEVLRRVGLGSLPGTFGAVPLRELTLAGWGHHARVPLRGSVALSRRTLDAALARAAARAGATFVTRTRARLGPLEDDARVVELDGPEGSGPVRARVVVAADGLGGSLLAQAGAPRPGATAAPASRVGLGTILPAGADAYQPGVIYMAVADAGYVGLVRQEDGRLDVAAALDPACLRTHGGPDGAVRRIIGGAGLPDLPAGSGVEWAGTPALTRHPGSAGAPRLFAVGDAAGYVEPFTGEGIGWALADAEALAPVAAEAARSWRPRLLEHWCRLRARRRARAERLCRAVAWTLRRPRLSRAAILAASTLPMLAAPFVARAARTPLEPRGIPA